MNELDLIEYICQLAGADSGSAADSLIQGIGDDCAVITKNRDTVLLLTMDTLIESVHFDCSWHPPDLLGQKAVAVNVSDIAAMGGKAVFALLSLGLPAGFDKEWCGQLSKGITGACRQYGCLLVGGDTVCSPDRVSLTLTVIGEMKKAEVLYRHTARPGDIIWISGPLGWSAAGLALLQSAKYTNHPESHSPEWQSLIMAHLAPQVRTDLAAHLARTGLVHAMMDLSDGLATDLAHICERSRVGAKIFADQLPRCAALSSAGEFLQKDPLAWMLSGGEDYELLFTAAATDSVALLRLAAEQECIMYPVGTIIEGQGVTLIRKQAIGNACTAENISFQGYDHFKHH